MPERDNEIAIPKEHQEIVLNRIKNSKEEDLLKWDDVKDKFVTAEKRRITSNKKGQK
jgi:hypothetical protein